ISPACSSACVALVTVLVDSCASEAIIARVISARPPRACAAITVRTRRLRACAALACRGALYSALLIASKFISSHRQFQAGTRVVYHSLQALSLVVSSTLLSFGASWLPLSFGSCPGLLLNRGIFNALVIVRRRLLVAAARRAPVGKCGCTLISFLL